MVVKSLWVPWETLISLDPCPGKKLEISKCSHTFPHYIGELPVTRFVCTERDTTERLRSSSSMCLGPFLCFVWMIFSSSQCLGPWIIITQKYYLSGPWTTQRKIALWFTLPAFFSVEFKALKTLSQLPLLIFLFPLKLKDPPCSRQVFCFNLMRSHPAQASHLALSHLNAPTHLYN